MGTLRTTTLLSSYVGLPLSSTAYTVNEDGTVDKKKSQRLTTSIATSTTTLATEDLLDRYQIKKSHDRLTSSYIDSLSDDELAQALEQLDLLEIDNNEKNDCKTI